MSEYDVTSRVSRSTLFGLRHYIETTKRREPYLSRKTRWSMSGQNRRDHFASTICTGLSSLKVSTVSAGIRMAEPLVMI